MTATDPHAGPAAPLPGARAALGLLLAINLFNYIDRYILAAVLPKIKLDATIFRPDDPDVNFKLGLLGSCFMWSYMVFSPVFGRLGDTLPRWGLVGAAVIAWSLATGATGLAGGFVILFLTRCFVGVGEAAYGPVAPSMLSDLYPVDHRGRVMAWFYMAIPVGSALGYVVGGQIAETAFGWRGAFLAAVVPGVFLGVACFLMTDRRPARDEVARGPSYVSVLRGLLRNRSFVLCCAGMTASTFILGGVANWIPVYIFEREARFQVTTGAVKKVADLKRSDGSPAVPPATVATLGALVGPDVLTVAELRDRLKSALTADEFAVASAAVFDAAPVEGSVTNGQVSLIFGVITVLAGLSATLLGGVVGDRLRNRGVRGAYFHVAGWGTLAGLPFFIGLLYAPFPAAWGLTFLAVFALFFNTGPANTVLANVTRSEIRATAFAINIFVIHALGDAISPALIGAVADRWSLHTAFLIASVFIPLAAFLWVAGANSLDDDTRRATEGT